MTTEREERGGIPAAASLPEGLLAWISELGCGDVTGATRHAARREAWVVDVAPRVGATRSYFLRLDRDPAVAAGPWSVRKEARVVDALARAGLPVPALRGWNETFQAAVYDCLAGRADLDRDTTRQQRWELIQQFIRYVADLHRLDPDSLRLDDVLDWPTTPRDVALAEVHHTEELIGGAGGEPLVTFGLKWLRNHAPAEAGPVTLVQGDTGPGNFLFEGDRLSGVVDFEWAHFGDPMEDLGHLRLRDFFFPSGWLAEALRLYGELSRTPIDVRKVRYYTIQPLVRSLVWLRSMTRDPSLDPVLALNLAYLIICDRAACEAMADDMGVTLHRPDPFGAPPLHRGSSLAHRITDNLHRQVLPALESEWPRTQLTYACLLIDSLDRVSSLGAEADERELEDMTPLLGHRPASAVQGLQELDELIAASDESDDVSVLRYLARRAYRAEQLYAPLVNALFPGRRFTPLAR